MLYTFLKLSNDNTIEIFNNKNYCGSLDILYSYYEDYYYIQPANSFYRYFKDIFYQSGYVGRKYKTSEDAKKDLIKFCNKIINGKILGFL